MEDASDARAAFPSVREAVSIYGEKIHTASRKKSVVERRAALEHELDAANKELEDVKQQLAASLLKTDQVELELQKTKVSAGDVESRLEDALSELARIKDEHRRGMLELECLKQTHVSDLETAQETINMLQTAVQTSMAACASAAIQAREGITAIRTARHLTHETDATPIEELMSLLQAENQQAPSILAHEIYSLRQEVADLAETYVRVSENSEAELQASKSATQKATDALKQTTEKLELLTEETDRLLEAKESELGQLKQELRATRDAEAVAFFALKTPLQEHLNEAKVSESETLTELAKVQEELRLANGLLRKDLSETLRIGTNDETNCTAKVEVPEAELLEISREIAEVKRMLLERDSEAHWKVSSAVAEASAARIREQHMMIRMDTMRAELDAAKLQAVQKPPDAPMAAAKCRSSNGHSRKTQGMDDSSIAKTHSSGTRKMWTYLSKAQEP